MKTKKQQKIQFDIITALPGVIDSYFKGGMMKKAIDKRIIKVKEHNLHDFSMNKYGSVDDRPYGGGAGMVLSVEPIYKALKKIGSKDKGLGTKKIRIILFSAAGKKFTQRDAERLVKYDQLVFVCGRYEGVDERVVEFVDEEISIGDYVLTGGELPALVVIDAVSRLIPGVLGNVDSARYESHAVEGILEYPQYTKPETFQYKEGSKKKGLRAKKMVVPEVLKSGNHKLINEWREKNRKHNG
jgi:tRNA (guanine37-N1)-methyltransferase